MTGAWTALVLALTIAAPSTAAVRVGSKSFTESIVLGEIATELVRADGVAAEHQRALGGSRVLWEALRRGAIDVYPDYTGTLSREILGGTAPPDPAPLREKLAEVGIGLTGSLGFEDGYAIGVRRDVAERLSLSRVSDLARHPELRLGFSNEFMDRADGWPAVRERYGVRAPHVRGLEHDLAYRALRSGELDATDVYTTDPEVRRDGIVLLTDDRHAFPAYDAVLVYRLDLARRVPRALEALRTLEGRTSAAEMAALNARVQLDHAPVEEVAASFLQTALGIVGPSRSSDGLFQRLARRTREHLALVAVALLAAIVCAVPLGVVAAKRPRAGRLILGAVGVLQTIPALALLVFMIPLLGIGATPAIAALFLYALLPIVRNVHTGLTGIAPELLEMARALGLPAAARLRRIELPLAAPAIVAGIRTSAVITVGGATLGALIGAGGYGQPILAGVRLASVPLILEGAVPAALLAFAVEGALTLVERVVVSRGLR